MRHLRAGKKQSMVYSLLVVGTRGLSGRTGWLRKKGGMMRFVHGVVESHFELVGLIVGSQVPMCAYSRVYHPRRQPLIQSLLSPPFLSFFSTAGIEHCSIVFYVYV